MCGISGVLAPEITEKDRRCIQAIMHSQNMRGPDHQALELIQNGQESVLLAHNRLSIVDLTAEANQPMWDTSQRLCVVYNGEIYNYLELRAELKNKSVFKTQSDTEIILNGFLVENVHILHQFSGPFAFSLYDKEKKQLWLCRDRFGVRPLFYYVENERLYFASTTHVLAKTFHLKPNLKYIARGVTQLTFENHTHETAYEKLFSLPPGHYLVARYEKNQLKIAIHAYYNLIENVKILSEKIAGWRPAQCTEDVQARLDQAVKIRLRSDVPIAIALSSGLDSTTIAALTKKYIHPFMAFTLGHPNHKKTEAPHVQAAARWFNLPIEYVWPSPQEMINALTKTIEVQDAPFSSLSVVAQHLLYQHVKNKGYKVLLGGQGGDEVFMGYKKYFLFILKSAYRDKNYFELLKNLLYLFPNILSELGQIKQYWSHAQRYLRTKVTPFFLDLPELGKELSGRPNSLHGLQIADICYKSLPTLLRYEDRNALGNAVETRLPFLDHHVVELGVALPASLKLHKGYSKWVIRQMMSYQIPDFIRLARYKRGFDIPLQHFITQGLGQAIREILFSNANQLRPFLFTKMNTKTSFSDHQLIHQPRIMTEAITLLWLNKVLL